MLIKKRNFLNKVTKFCKIASFKKYADIDKSDEARLEIVLRGKVPGVKRFGHGS